MRRALLTITLCLAAVSGLGCTHWVHANKDRQQWYGDFHECAGPASQIADYANGYVRGGIGIEFRLYPDVKPTLFRPFGKRLRENCMQERGWTRGASSDENGKS